MKIFSIDIGNTTTRFGLIVEDQTKYTANVLTHSLQEMNNGLSTALKDVYLRKDSLDGIAFSSVVPAATKWVEDILSMTKFSVPFFHLTCENCPIPINYPNPQEIGQDRLANAIGARILYGIPTVVIDMGTTVNFDIVTKNGYEGGIIAPGLEVITRYLHEQTALLPQLNPKELIVSTGMGKTTIEAMKIGCVVGFDGMIRSLLDCVRAEINQLGYSEPTIIATGGSTGILPQKWLEDIEFNPDITLQGLAAAFIQCKKG